MVLSVVVAAGAIWLIILAWQAEPGAGPPAGGHPVDAGASRWALVPGLFAQRLGILAVVVAWVLAALGFGCELGALVIPAGVAAGERWLFRAGLGIGVTALLVLGLGALGAFWALSLLWLVGVAALLRRVWEERARLRAALGVRPELRGFEWVWVLVSVLALVIALVSAFLPPLTYDVLEYHLGVPARYLEAGRVAALPTNVYSNFPLTVEMHYLVGLAALGKVEGGCFAQVFNGVVSLLAALAVGALAWELFRQRGAALLAIALFATTSWFLVLASSIQFVEPTLTLLTLLALLAFVRCGASGWADMRWLVLAGLLTGFAYGAKYPAALFLAAPLATWLGVRWLVRREASGRALVHVLFFTGALLVAISPWLIKNVVVTGNPVFPLLQGAFDGGGWGEAERARWEQAHTLGIGEPRELPGDLRDLLMEKGELPALILSAGAFAFLPLLLLAPRRRPAAWALMAYVAVCLALWLVFTHRIQRFLVPTLAVAVALSAGGVEGLRTEGLRRLLRVLVTVLMGISVFGAWPGLNRLWALDLSRPEPFLRELLRVFPYPACEFARALPPGERMLSVGEARSFYFGPNVRTETVFDRKLLDELLVHEPEPKELARRLERQGFRYLFVNWWELSRLQCTYAYDYGGRKHAGYSERIDSKLFAGLEAAGAVTAVRAWGPPIYTVEMPTGWRYPPPTEREVQGGAVPAGALVAFHPALYVVYRIGEQVSGD